MTILPSSNAKLVAAEITSAGVVHAVTINPIRTATTPNGEALYHVDLKASPFTGINPFTGRPDTLSHFTDLLIYNGGTTGIAFTDDDQITMTIEYNTK